MISNLPIFINAVFIATVFLTFWFFYKSTKNNKKVYIVLLVWVLVQSTVSYSGFYTLTHSLPPRFVLIPLPPLITILLLFIIKDGRTFLYSLNEKWLTYLHVVRIPVELVLYWLFLEQAVPQLMTFAGRNFDIIAGITAPIIAYFAYSRNKLGRTAVLLWNIIGLILLLSIVGHAILSLPFQFQQLAFDQPNIAVLYFPFALLPGFIVPVVLLSHLVVIFRPFIKQQ